jgi:acetyl-CoA carboxylase carboxyl transferase subunit alpha
LIDGVIKEPVGGAHANPEKTFETVKKEIIKHISKLEETDPEKRIANRIRKYSKMGVFVEE